MGRDIKYLQYLSDQRTGTHATAYLSCGGGDIEHSQNQVEA